MVSDPYRKKCIMLTATRHEHLYKKIAKNTINKLPKPSALKRVLEGSKVVLCTLSMISSSRLKALTGIVPITNVIVDEASQIEISQYIPLFKSYGNTLRKLCFIGDDKQCGRFHVSASRAFMFYIFPVPPHGQDDLKTLQSIFELDHLKASAEFLDTQCENQPFACGVFLTDSRIEDRMPPQIGDFISQQIYGGELKSNPDHPTKSGTVACRFVDICGTEQLDADGKSSMVSEAIVSKEI